MATVVQTLPTCNLDALRLLRERGYPVKEVVDVQPDHAILWLNLDSEPQTTWLLGGTGGYEPVSVSRAGFLVECPGV